MPSKQKVVVFTLDGQWNATIPSNGGETARRINSQRRNRGRRMGHGPPLAEWPSKRIFISSVIYTRHFRIRRPEFDASALRFKRAARAGPRSPRIQLKSWIYWLAGPINCFVGPWRGAVADVIEPLNRDYPRVIECGDTRTRRSFFLPLTVPPLRRFGFCRLLPHFFFFALLLSSFFSPDLFRFVFSLASGTRFTYRDFVSFRLLPLSRW